MQLSDGVERLKTMGEAEDRMEFLEQVTAHLCDRQFERSKDPNERKIAEMVNLMEAR